MERYITRHKPIFGKGIEEISPTPLTTIEQPKPLSNDTDPRVLKLKKELQQLSIAPKPKYIKLFTK